MTNLKGGKAPPGALSAQWNEGREAPGLSTLKASESAPRPPSESLEVSIYLLVLSETPSFSGSGLKQQSGEVTLYLFLTQSYTE